MLSLFPQAGFDQSVTTPVLLGVLVSWMFTETLGWVFAGLVVPGYLAAVFLLHPVSGAIDIIEALATYGAARLIGEYLSWTGLTTRAFGRERFFLVVLVSVLVRLAIEGVFLPRVAPHANWAFSIGLVVVPLAANACWKTGLMRGIVQNGVPTLIVYLLLRYILVPHTNLSLEGFELATENVAASFLGSPKAYILLTSGAVLAAAANVRYGWDFNGILVPALLGLCVVEPLKLLTTLVETVGIIAIVALLIRLPPLRRANLEGPRRTVLFFTVDYILRFVLAASLGRRLPGGDIVAFMGFGYLVPTLLAVKIAQKDSIALVLLPTAKVSIASFVVGTAIGFLTLALDRGTAAAAPATRAMPTLPEDPVAATMMLSVLSESAGSPDPDSRLVLGGEELWKLAAAAGANDFEVAREKGLEPQRLGSEIVVLRERFETPSAKRGLPAVLARQRGPIVVFVPSPSKSPVTAAVAGLLLRERGANAVVLAGIDRDVERWPESVAHATARSMGTVVTLVTRSSTTASPVAASPAFEALAGPLTTRRIPFSITTDSDGWATLEVNEDAASSALATPTDNLPNATVVDLSAIIGALPRDYHETSFEHGLAMRRLVLAPLLRGERGPARRLVPLVANALGYRFMEHGEAPLLVLLASRSEPKPIAMVARGDRPIRTVVEEVRGAHVDPRTLALGREERDLALRLFAQVSADAVVFGLGPRPFHGDALRAAHAEVVLAAGDGARFLVIRESAFGGDAGTGATSIATLRRDPPTNDLVAATERAIAPLEIATSQPPETSEREIAGRITDGKAALVFLRPSETLIGRAALESGRATARWFGGAPIPRTEDDVKTIARRLTPQLAPSTNTTTLASLVTLCSRVVIEESISARNELVARIGAKEVHAALTLGANDQLLVMLAKTPRTTAIVAMSRNGPGKPPIQAGTFDACLDYVQHGGACEAP